MVQINFAQKTVNVKIVYYGPGMSGKTTNLEVIHQRAPEGNHGDLTSISTDGDRTLFFDYMPLDLGTVAGMRTAFQLYTVPGQVYYNSTRKLVLQGVDGIIFVADSSAAMINQNLESLRNLEENLNEYGKSLATLPHVIQFNKRDLPDAMSVEEMQRALNPYSAPVFEGVANTGQGVFPTLKALAASVLKNIMSESTGAKSGYSAQGHPSSPARPPAAPAARPAAAPHGAPRAPAAHHAPAQGHQPMPNYAQPAPMPNRPAPPAIAAHGNSGGGFMGAGPAHGMTPGGPYPGAPAHHGHPAQQAGGLQLAQPRQVGHRPGVEGGHQARPARPASAPAARPRATAHQVTVPAHAKKRGRLLPVLIGVGAGAGALLAWVLMNVL